MKNKLVQHSKSWLPTIIAALVVFTVEAGAAAPISVSVTGDFIQIQKHNKCFIAKVEQPQNLLAVHVLYPKRDFSEYVLGPGVSSLKGEELWGYYSERWAGEKEWKRISGEWKQIRKSVSFEGITGSIKVDDWRRYTLLGYARNTNDKEPLILTFKVEYLNTGKEGVEVIPWERFKIRPKEGKPFLMGSDNGMLVPVTESQGARFVSVE